MIDPRGQQASEAAFSTLLNRALLFARWMIVAALPVAGSDARAVADAGITGTITAEAVWFRNDAAPDVVRRSVPPIGTLTLAWSRTFEAAGARWAFSARPRWIATRSDDPRRGFQWDELYLEMKSGQFELKAGFLKEHWGVLETRQLVDLLNTYDSLDGLIPEKKLSRKLIKASVRLGGGQLDVYHFLPKFDPQQYYRDSARFLPIRVEPQPEYVGGADPQRPGDAARYWIAGDDLDVGISLYRGVNREPSFSLGSSGWVTQYAQVRQLGIDATKVTGRTTYKLEMLRQWADDADRSGWKRSVGIEYVFPRFVRAADLSLLAEYHHDKVGEAAPASIFDRKLLIGGRLEFNDLGLSSAFVGWMEDLRRRGNRMLIMRMEIGLTDEIRFALVGNIPRAAPNDAQWRAIQRDGYLKFELSHAFSL